MLLTDARRPGRGPAPTARWCRSPSRTARAGTRDEIAEGVALVTRRAGRARRSARTSCRRRSRPCTTRRATPRTPTGAQILALYELLEPARAQPDGHAQPRGRRGDGARARGRAGAAGGARRDERIAGHHRLEAVRAHLLELAGDDDGAAAATATPRGARRACPSSATWRAGRASLEGGREVAQHPLRRRAARGGTSGRGCARSHACAGPSGATPRSGTTRCARGSGR